MKRAEVVPCSRLLALDRKQCQLVPGRTWSGFAARAARVRDSTVIHLFSPLMTQYFASIMSGPERK